MIFKIKKVEDKHLEEIYNNSLKELGDFFGIKWVRNKPRIMLIDDRKTINKLKQEETEDWLVGWSEYQDIFILDRKNYEKESCHEYSEEEYIALIKHELAHVFTFLISSKSSNPTWLWEGLAIYLSGQNKFKKKPDKLNKFLDFYDKHSKEVYQESGFAIQKIISKFGKEKILELLKSLDKVNSREEFNELFFKVYGFYPEYENFNSI